MPIQTILLMLTLCIVSSGCSSEISQPSQSPAQLFPDGRLIDLTHSFSSKTIYWPTAKPFTLEKVSDGVTPGGYYYAANNFSAAEHGGTHLDAPIHFAAGKNSTDQIPIDRLMGPAVIIDVAAAAQANRDYQVQVSDIEGWEMANGRIPDNSIVLLRTGWDARWPDRESYLGTLKVGAEGVAELHFPGLDPKAARWIVENRQVDAIGIDTPSIDYGQSMLFESHQALFAANIPAFENVANLRQLPTTGASIIALPMKIEGGSGGPLRIIAIAPPVQ